MSTEPMSRTKPADGRHGEMRIRPARADDAAAMGDYWARNREHLTPTQPSRPDVYWTQEGQRLRLASFLADMSAGRALPLLVFEDAALVAEVTVSDIIRGVFESALLGYSVDADRLRRGIARWAVNAAVDIVFTELELHRLQAATLLDNVASQGVLERCGFEPVGVARDYLAIAGSWRHHVLWQRTNAALPPPRT